MLQSIWEDVKREFSYGNMVTRIVIVNVVVFIVVNITKLLLFISNGGEASPVYDEIVHFFSISNDWWQLLTHPWVIFTHMFLHENFWHLLWNMLYLYWFGRIVGDFIGNQRVLPIYLLGGLMGALLFFITANLLPYGTGGTRYALGASAAVMAVVVAAGAISPDYIMRLLFLGDVKLKYIVLVLVLLDLFALASNMNTGGHFAHLGGALMGWIFVRQLREGNDWALPINTLFDKIGSLFRRKRQPRRPQMAYKNPNRTARTATNTGNSRKPTAVTDKEDLSDQERLDTILDKIKQSGYESLTEREKEFLFNASKK